MAECRHEFVFSDLLGDFVCWKCYQRLTKAEKLEALEYANQKRKEEEEKQYEGRGV